MPHPNRRIRRFADLMPHRVREVLLVSSPYDAFILEEDGGLGERIYDQYRQLSLTDAPRFTLAENGERALEKLENRRFDLIIAMTRVADMDVSAFARQVKELRPGRPVVLLALDRTELSRLESNIDREAVDGVFLWSGDARILLAIIKLVEDRENVDEDIATTNVRVIVLVEDSVRFVSLYTGLLYEELLTQGQSLYTEGVNPIQRLAFVRSRPKILLARDFETAVGLIDQYQDNLMGLITDGRFPRGGRLDSDAGLALIAETRRRDPQLPILIQSSESHQDVARRAESIYFLNKNSVHLLRELRTFLTDGLGFGRFVFRMSDGRMVDEARDLRELEEKLSAIPDESLRYHAERNHFSVWLNARGEFDTADALRPRTLAEFADIGEVRHYLLEAIRKGHEELHEGVVSDFDPAHLAHESFSRIGSGSLGGKARGLAFLNMLFADNDVTETEDLAVHLPPTIVIATDYFDRFIAENDKSSIAGIEPDDESIREQFAAAWLPEELRDALLTIVTHFDVPLSVRSSSLLEDSIHHPFAGIYGTYMIANNAAETAVRHEQLCRAVKLVYASTFCKNARTYLKNTGARVDEEKMAVIIQPVIGRRHGDRFYPEISGLAQSFNFYPIGPQTSGEGIAHLALGLGRTIMEGGRVLRFSPAHPGVLPQFATPRAVMDASQRQFFALDLSMGEEADFIAAVRSFDLSDAEEDGALALVGSVFDEGDDVIRDDLSKPGPRAVTFNNILKHRAIALAEALVRLLHMGRDGMGGAVEIEFAVHMGDFGRRTPRTRLRREPTLYVLQIRPLASREAATDATIHVEIPPIESCLAVTEHSLGHGYFPDLRDILFVRPETWEAAANEAIAAQIETINAELSKAGRPYILIGPGRWGSADPWLGVPVQWSQISGVKIMVEASPADYPVDPSQGTHFFQNITSLRIGYLTLPPGANREQPKDAGFLDWAWLTTQPAAKETEYLRLVRFEQDVGVYLDGRTGRGIIARPGAMRVEREEAEPVTSS
ncbi:MAG: hypothetical protein H6683_06210 [Deltaproteobacteria bacterium]|nr:hypothetical protein [Deltaproteobacteria bacterium]